MTVLFFPRLKSVYRGKEGYLGNQRYGVKAAEHEGGPTTQDVLLPSASLISRPYRNIVYSWKDTPTVSLETMAPTHKYVRTARLDADAT